jgi:hypothetical protein
MSYLSSFVLVALANFHQVAARLCSNTLAQPRVATLELAITLVALGDPANHYHYHTLFVVRYRPLL